MPTLHLKVSEELKRFLAQARVAHDPANVARLRAAVAVGAKQFERGETSDFTAESVIAEAHAAYRRQKEG